MRLLMPAGLFLTRHRFPHMSIPSRTLQPDPVLW